LGNKDKKLHWVSLSVGDEAQLERHRLDGEENAELCRKLVRRFIGERPKIVHETSEPAHPLKTEYRFWDERSITEKIGADVTLSEAIAAAATLDPLTPITSADELLADLKSSFGLGLVSITEAFNSVHGRVGLRGENSPGRKMISELRSDRKIALRRLHGLSRTIDGTEYTHLEILAGAQLPSVANRRLRELIGGSQKRRKKAFSMSPIRIEGTKGLTLGYWLSSKYLKGGTPETTVAIDNLRQSDVYSKYAEVVLLLKRDPTVAIEFKLNRTHYCLAGPGSLDIQRVFQEID
jgi:hypothetical protein